LHAKRTPDKVAIVSHRSLPMPHRERLTFREMYGLSNRFANALSGLIEPGVEPPF